MSTSVHPGWDQLLTWLKGKGASISSESVPIEARASPGAGYGLIARQDLQDSAKFLRIPANALMNILTLGPLYPPSARTLNAIQLISLHLYLHSVSPDAEGSPTESPFGPYISVLPRDFSFHPLTWLCAPEKNDAMAELLKNVPPTVMVKMSNQANRLRSDWVVVRKYLRKNPSIVRNLFVSRALESSTAIVDENFIWAWLIVNTRCIYCRLNYNQSDADNLTLSPIVDFTNHIGSGHSLKVEFNKQMGGDLILSLPDGYTACAGDELYLTYGRHPNSTLFTEYGFVNHSQANREGEAELDALLIRQFEARGSVGSYLKEVLQENNYWGDWTVHLSPAPAYPSYRLITALRLYHSLDESVEELPPDIDAKLEIWKNTVLGNRETINPENEASWRANLYGLCQELVRQARLRVASLSQLNVENWMKGSVSDLQILCEEEIAVGLGVCQSIESNVEF